MLHVALLVSLGVASPALDLSWPNAKGVVPTIKKQLELVNKYAAHLPAKPGRQMSEEFDFVEQMDEFCEELRENEDEVRDSWGRRLMMKEPVEGRQMSEFDVDEFIDILMCMCSPGMMSFLKKHSDTFEELTEPSPEKQMEIMKDMFGVLCSDSSCGTFLEMIFMGLEEEGDTFAAGDKMAKCVCDRPNVMHAIMDISLEYESKGKEPDDEELLEAAFATSAVGFCSSDICIAAINAQPEVPKGAIQGYCENVPAPSGGTVVKVEATVAGSVNDFDEDAYKSRLATYLEVEEDAITLTVTSGSVKVSAEVETGSPENAVTAVMKAEALAEDEDAASAVLGVEVESMAVEDPTNAGSYQSSLGEGSALKGPQGPSAGVIGGAAAGAVVALGLAVALYCFKCRKSNDAPKVQARA